MVMEVLSAQYPIHTPQSLSAKRESRPRPPLPASGLQQQQHQHQQHQHQQQQHYHHQPSAPASQDSEASGRSYALPDSSNVSQLTNLTELSSHVSPKKPQDLHKLQTTASRARTPENDCALTSPMSITSPVFANGTKRTASGHVKNVPSLPGTPYKSIFSPARVRADSMSSTGSRAGELAASLKMRLGYAMTKVQNGWEHKTIGELEHLTSTKPSSNRQSMSHIATARPSTAAADNRAQFGMDTAMSPPSKRRSGMYGASSVGKGPQLQPAADIRSHQHTRSADLRSLPLTNMEISAMSPPQTPHARYPRRPATIRTDTQTAEAERDALQALTQLGSPHNSQYSRHHNASQANSSQASPLRSEFAPVRRVSFARGGSDSSAIESSSDDGVVISQVNGRV